jgi:hypothetical protein
MTLLLLSSCLSGGSLVMSLLASLLALIASRTASTESSLFPIFLSSKGILIPLPTRCETATIWMRWLSCRSPGVRLSWAPKPPKKLCTGYGSVKYWRLGPASPLHHSSQGGTTRRVWDGLATVWRHWAIFNRPVIPRLELNRMRKRQSAFRCTHDNFNQKRNLKTPVKTRTLHLSEPYDSLGIAYTHPPSLWILRRITNQQTWVPVR